MRSPNPIDIRDEGELPLLAEDTYSRVRRVLDEALAELELTYGDEDTLP
jgi:hypothetical protein